MRNMQLSRYPVCQAHGAASAQLEAARRVRRDQIRGLLRADQASCGGNPVLHGVVSKNPTEHISGGIARMISLPGFSVQ